MSQASGPGPRGDRTTPTAVLLAWAARVPAPPRRREPRHRLGPAVALVLLLVAAVALAASVTDRLLERHSAATLARATETPAPAAAPPATAGSDPGRRDPGVHVRVSPRADGTLDVVEQVRFLGAATGLEVALPEAKGVVAGVRPKDTRITDLQVFSDGHLLPRQSGPVTTGGRVLLPNAPLAVELRYRLVGAATVSKPSTPGRALVLLPPISTDDTLDKLPVVVEVTGTGVRNVVCPGLATDDQLCGRRTRAGWRTITLQPSATAVLAQLDLTRY